MDLSLKGFKSPTVLAHSANQKRNTIGAFPHTDIATLTKTGLGQRAEASARTFNLMA